MEEESTLILGLIAANWSALSIALKCREKIDSCRDILLGITGEKPHNEDVKEYLYQADVLGFAWALLITLAGVGSLILSVGIYILSDHDFCVIGWLFLINGVLMLGGALFVGWRMTIDLPELKRLAGLDKVDVGRGVKFTRSADTTDRPDT